MSRRALIVDSDEGFSDLLRGWLSAYGLEVVVATEWNEGLVATVEPVVTFLGAELPDKAGLALCGRARELWRGVPVVVASASLPPDEQDLHQKTEAGAHAYLDKRTLTREELLITMDALIGPVPAHGEPGGSDGVDEGAGGRVAELEEEVRQLRWELDQTTLAAQSAPYSRDFLRLAEVVGTKEKEIVRLKKEIWARDHKIATGQRVQREASARALVATRERTAATGHAAQLQKELEEEQAEIRRLRVELQRQGAEATQAVAGLADERQKHEETRRGHEIALVTHAEVLRQVTDDQLRTHGALEAQLREEKEQATAALSAGWRAKLKAVRRRRDHSLALLHDQIRDLEAAHRQELAARDLEFQTTLARSGEAATAERQAALAAAGQELTAARTDSERQHHELQLLHDASLAEALRAHADAEARAEQHRAALVAAEIRLRAERDEAVDAAAAAWERKLEDLRRAHTDSVETLRRHFQEQLAAAQAQQEQERVKRDSETEATLGRAAEDVAAVRAQAARLGVETRQRHEQELSEVQARGLEALAALEARLREERDEAVAAVTADAEARLDRQRREHAESDETLRRQHRELVERLQASGAEELAGARARAAELEGETRRRFELELGRVQAAHVEALTALETELREENAQAVAAALLTFEEKLDELRVGHLGSLHEAGRQYADELTSLRASHARAEAERESRHHEALAAARAEHLEAGTRIEARLREEQSRAVAEAVALWEQKLEALRRDHAGSVETLRQAYRVELDALVATGAQELGRRDEEQRGALRRGAEELAVAQVDAARRDQEARHAHEVELARAETGHLEVLRGLEERFRAEREQAVAAAVATWQDMLEELRREHQEQLTALRAVREQELALRDDEHEAALRRLGEELAVARSKASPPAPAQLQARQAEALKALEKRLRDEKEQALSAAAIEWKARMERLRRGHADSLAALRREHQDELLALEAARQENLAKQPFADQGGKVVPLKAVTRDRSS